MSSLQDVAKQLIAAPQQQNPALVAPAPVPVPTAPPPAPVDPNAPPPALAPIPETAPPGTMAAPIAGAGPIDPNVVGAVAQANEPPAMNLHGAHRILANEQQSEHDERIDYDKAMAESKKAVVDQTAIAGKQAEAAQPLLQQDVVDQQAQLKATQDAQVKNNAIANKYAQDYGATMQAMQDKYNNQPTDVFGRAGVNKIAGGIGLLLGTLGGSANGGKNAGVERLNQLTQQKLAQDKYEYEMLGKRANMQTNLYAQMRQNGMDDIAATNAAAAIKTGIIASQIKQRMNGFVPQKAQADANKALADLDMQRVGFVQAGHQHVFTQAMQVAQLEQREREMEQRKEMLEMKLGAAQNKPDQEANPIKNDVQFDDPHFGKNNKAVMGRLQVQNQALKEAFAQYHQYKSSSNWDWGKRAGLRKGIAGSLATTDVGNARVSEARVKAAETETGADPALHVGPIEIGQKGVFSPDVDGRLEQALRTRAEVYYNSIKAAGGHLPAGSPWIPIFKELHVGPEYPMGETPSTIATHEGDLRNVALEKLRAMQKQPGGTSPATSTAAFVYPSGV